ncbi:DUF6525 family protein [Cribrihabitans neustonicus]|uniref:DUF6525 family protein n=1 Tax=Cribrihabitans neustonicus TaxID=1429085 RepID=UPI003B5B3374
MADRKPRRNLNSRLKRRRREGSPMQAYDALPPPLRRWLASACLPWSPASALRLWTRAGGSRDPEAAAARLDAAEAAMLARDAGIWERHPRPQG